MAIANSTEDGNHTITKSSVALQFLEQLRTFSFPLSIIAFVGNILIIVALQKVSSLYPPSKHLLGCLASTDLGVGLIHIPYEVESICLEITRRTGTTSGSFLSSRVCCLAAYLY